MKTVIYVSLILAAAHNAQPVGCGVPGEVRETGSRDDTDDVPDDPLEPNDEQPIDEEPEEPGEPEIPEEPEQPEEPEEPEDPEEPEEPVDPTAPVACPMDAFFCEDFEAMPEGEVATGATWKVVVDNKNIANRSLAIVSDASYSGQRALRAQTFPLPGQATNNWQNFIEHNLPSPPPEHLYMRVFLYVEKFPAKETNNHWWLFETRSAADQDYNGRPPTAVWGGHVVRWLNGTYGPAAVTAANMNLNYDSFPGESHCCGGSEPLPSGQWVCIEAYVDHQNDSAMVWLNGNQVLSTTNGIGANSDIPPQVAVKIGYATNNGVYIDGGSALFDDIAAGPTRIGCGPTN